MCKITSNDFHNGKYLLNPCTYQSLFMTALVFHRGELLLVVGVTEAVSDTGSVTRVNIHIEGAIAFCCCASFIAVVHIIHLCHLSWKINSAATHFILYKVQLADISVKPRILITKPQRNLLATRSAGDTNYLHHVR